MTNGDAYYQAAQFGSELQARNVYAKAQNLIYGVECDLSTYRFLSEKRWHVVVMGTQPPNELHLKLENVLLQGKMVTLPSDLLNTLVARRRQKTPLGPWVEGHYHQTPKVVPIVGTEVHPLIAVVLEIVEAAGEHEAFEHEVHFHLRLEQEPYMPLVIEAWRATTSYFGEKRHINVAHYFEMNGDLVADPDVLMTDQGHPIEITQPQLYTSVLSRREGKTEVNTAAKRSVEKLMNMWAENIRAQGWIEVAAKRKEGC